MSLPSSVIVILVLLTAELLYFVIARKFKIVDVPNKRSSHHTPVIRGGGIIFVLSLWIWFFLAGDIRYAGICIATTAIAVVSFVDDLKAIPARIRITVHAGAVLLMFYELGFSWPWWFLLIAFIISIGTLNAFNFMDGINGITGVYALVMLATYLYINISIVEFISEGLILFQGYAVIVFLFFNLRKEAICFAGDVGSISIAFVLVFLLLRLVSITGNYFYCVMFLVFGVDSIATIALRIRNRENIFAPHRTHLYQLMANQLRISQVPISLTYGFGQLLLNASLILLVKKNASIFIVLIALAWVLFYVIVRIFVEKRIGKMNPRIS